MSILFTFPGQGSQKPGMLQKLNVNGVTQGVFEQASDMLGYNVFDLDLQAAQKNNKNVQVGLTVCAIACVELLASEGIQADYVLGLSIGAFPAAIASKMISFEQGLQLVSLRGKLMSDAYPTGYAMAAIIGLPLHKIQALINSVNQTHLPVYLANINTEYQYIISGPISSLEVICQQARLLQASSAKLMNVNVPSHCLLLEEQAQLLYQEIQTATFAPAQSTFVSANAARVIFKPELIKKDLAFNMAQQVKWWETAAMLNQRGVSMAIEMTPGSVLSKLCAASMPSTQCLSLETSSLNSIKVLADRLS